MLAGAAHARLYQTHALIGADRNNYEMGHGAHHYRKAKTSRLAAESTYIPSAESAPPRSKERLGAPKGRLNQPNFVFSMSTGHAAVQMQPRSQERFCVLVACKTCTSSSSSSSSSRHNHDQSHACMVIVAIVIAIVDRHHRCPRRRRRRHRYRHADGLVYEKWVLYKRGCDMFVVVFCFFVCI